MTSETTRPKAGSDHLSQEQLAELRHRLERERLRLLEQYEESEAWEREVPQGEPEDIADRAEDDLEREEIFAERERDRDELLRVEAALGRMESGHYGVCIDCGQKIPFERLRTVPATPYCTRHQEQHEEEAEATAMRARKGGERTWPNSWPDGEAPE